MTLKKIFILCLLLGSLILVYARIKNNDAPRIEEDKHSTEYSSAQPLSAPTRSVDAQDVATSFKGLTQQIVNPLETSNDLHAIYEKYKSSKNPVERAIAHRAWSACFPTFIAAQGQAIRIEQFSKGFPQNDPTTPRRLDAYRSLMGKCQQFSGLSREQLLQGTQNEQEAVMRGLPLTPGEQAQQHLNAGETDHALQLVRSILRSGDPFAIASLQEFMHRYLSVKVEEQSLPSTTRIDIQELAFAIAGCELGLACDAGSLSAIQLCASSGECEGNLRERYTNRLQQASDRVILRQQTQKVLDAIRTNNFAQLGL